MLSRLFGRAPSTFNLRLMPGERALPLRADQSVLQAALEQGVPFPHSCRAGGCGACKCRLLAGKVKELSDKSYLLTAEEMRAHTILACQSLPRSDLVIELPASTGGPRHAPVSTWATITGLAPLAPDILALSLRSDAALAYTAGQYARLGLPGSEPTDEHAGRSYSFASARDPAGTGQDLNFIIRRVPGGAFSDWLFKQARCAERLWLQGPFGDFHLRPDARPILAVSAGSGFAPIQAMLEQALAEGQARRDVVLFFGARRQAELYAHARLAEFKRRWSGRFELVPVLSDEPSDSGWSGARGRLPPAMRTHLGTQLPHYQAYVCGPPPMVEACLQALAEAGLPSAHLHADKFLGQHDLHPA